MRLKDNYIKYLKDDAPAGLVVFLVALPLCLGIALASGAPLFSGIITGVVGGIVVGLISGSRFGVSGPAAGLTVIVATAITQLGSYESFLLAVVIAGVFQIILAILKAGIIGYYFPSSVIKGMLAAIGLLLILKQIPHALGFDRILMGDEAFIQSDGQNTFTDIYYAFIYHSPGAVLISIVSILILILFERPFMKKFTIFKFIPGALIVVILGIIINQSFKAFSPLWLLDNEHLVVLPVARGVSEFFSFFTFPDWSAISNPEIFIVAGTIAIVASLETLLCVEATDKLDPEKRLTPSNRELLAQGTGNMLSGLIGGIPLTQVIVRSSANINSGAKTKMSAVYHGILLLICAVFIPGLLNMIPLASLAAILLLVGYKLSKATLYRDMFKLGWDQFIPFMVTIIAILLTDLLKGIGIGMVVSIFFILRNNFRVSYFFHQEDVKEGEKIRIQLSEEVTFLNKVSIQLMLEKLPENSNVTIDGSRSQNIDYDVLEILQNFKEHGALLKNIQFQLTGIPEVKAISHH